MSQESNTSIKGIIAVTKSDVEQPSCRNVMMATQTWDLDKPQKGCRLALVLESPPLCTRGRTKLDLSLRNVLGWRCPPNYLD
jgi:hypothetical protein